MKRRVEEPRKRSLPKPGIFSRIEEYRAGISPSASPKPIRQKPKVESKPAPSKGVEDKENNPRLANKAEKKLSDRTVVEEKAKVEDKAKKDQVEEELEKEKKSLAECKRRLHSEKAQVVSLKNKVKQLEEEKKKEDDNHRRALLAIESRVSTLRNTNLQLLSRAHQFDDSAKLLQAEREAKAEADVKLR